MAELLTSFAVQPGLLLGALALLVPAVPLLFTIVNVLTWRRGSPSSGGRGSNAPGLVSILIPARNEEASIEKCIASALDQGEAVREIIVYSDGSTDGTDAVVEEISARDPRVRLIRGAELPNGWVGKPHACQRLFEHASGSELVFVDADVTLMPGGLERLLGLLRSPVEARVVTAVPRQLMGSWFERLILPLLTLTYTSWLPLRAVEWGRDPRFVAANGQLLAIRRSTLSELGGFEPVRDAIVDDMAFCRRAKARGCTVCFADGFAMAHCRMYASTKQVWEGFSKNIYSGLGGRLSTLLLVVTLHLWAFVVPYVVLVYAAFASGSTAGAWVFGAGGVLLNVALRIILVARYRQPIEGILLHPLGVLALVAISFNSLNWYRRGTVHWAGRTYEGRAMPQDVGASLPPASLARRGGDQV